jgi:hypothetical protein
MERGAAGRGAVRLQRQVWAGFKTSMVPSVGKGPQKKLVPDSYAFSPRREVCWGLPDGGMENFDMTRAQHQSGALRDLPRGWQRGPHRLGRRHHGRTVTMSAADRILFLED